MVTQHKLTTVHSWPDSRLLRCIKIDGTGMGVTIIKDKSRIKTGWTNNY